ncbi:hypothetical protein HN924_02840 [Candidatus Woesearchaeota archaeon]|jgi:hypothetical protein|nr:hypothetical protein [Candidatus Woesearchaeota archaeon]MBT7062879.1 hypothetical protein [Candidatus Woesearchaeota archaeon]MBT7402715.1 hypothetical protein [Candidatus Woesearchaeota archaeon]
MEQKTMSINKVVESLLDSKPFIRDAFKENIANYSGIARNLTPEIKRILGRRSINPEAVIMAVKRYAEKSINDVDRKKISALISKCDIRLKGNIVNVVLSKSDKNYALALAAYKKVNWQAGEIIHVYQSLTEIAVMVDTANQKLFSRAKPVHVNSNLAMVTLKTPKQAVESVGFIYYILGILARNGVAVVDIISTYTELNIILKEQDGAKVYNLLFNEIKYVK